MTAPGVTVTVNVAEVNEVSPVRDAMVMMPTPAPRGVKVALLPSVLATKSVTAMVPEVTAKDQSTARLSTKFLASSLEME